MNVFIAYADREDELATSRFRCFTPAAGLSRAGHKVAVRHISSLINHDLSVFDAVLAERVLSPQMVEYVRRYSKAKLVFTFDDAYSKMPPYSTSLYYWRKIGGLKAFYETLRLTDLNITPSDELCKLYNRSGTAPFKTVPNYMLPDRWLREYQRAAWKTDTPVIGWGGSSQHRESWLGSDLPDALHRLRQTHEFRLRLYGNREVFNPLTMRNIDYEYVGWVPWMAWPLELHNFDIVLAPSAYEYDRYRSCLRLTEAGMARVPFVASEHGAYAPGYPGGLTVPNTCNGWCDALRMLLENPNERSRYGELGYEWASEQMIDKNIGVYEEVLFG